MDPWMPMGWRENDEKMRARVRVPFIRSNYVYTQTLTHTNIADKFTLINIIPSWRTYKINDNDKMTVYALTIHFRYSFSFFLSLGFLFRRKFFCFFLLSASILYVLSRLHFTTRFYPHFSLSLTFNRAAIRGGYGCVLLRNARRTLSLITLIIVSCFFLFIFFTALALC